MTACCMKANVKCCNRMQLKAMDEVPLAMFTSALPSQHRIVSKTQMQTSHVHTGDAKVMHTKGHQHTKRHQLLKHYLQLHRQVTPYMLCSLNKIRQYCSSSSVATDLKTAIFTLPVGRIMRRLSAVPQFEIFWLCTSFLGTCTFFYRTSHENLQDYSYICKY